MEVEIIDSDGLPQDSVVLVRAGQQRRQAKLSAKVPFNFPTLPINSSSLRVEVLQPMCGKSLILTPDAERYVVKFPGDKNKHGSSIAAKLDLELTVKEASAPDVEVDDGNAVEETQADHMDRKQVAEKQARTYLDDFNILKYMQEMLATVIQEKPEDPFKFMGSYTRQHSDKCQKVQPAAEQLPPPPPLPGKVLEDEAGAAKAGLPQTGMKERQVDVTLAVHGIDYGSLTTAASLKRDFETAMKDVIAKQAGVGPDRVSLEISAGSIIVKASVMLAADTVSIPADKLLGQGPKVEVEKTLTALAVERMQQIPGIKAVIQDQIKVQVIELKDGPQADIPSIEEVVSQEVVARDKMIDDASEVSEPVDMEELLGRFQVTMFESCDNGKLEEALADITGSRGVQVSPRATSKGSILSGPVADTEELCDRVFQGMMYAAETGQLSHTLQDIKGKPAQSQSDANPSLDDLRGKLLDVLSEAADRGTLEEAVKRGGALEEAAGKSAFSPVALDTEAANAVKKEHLREKVHGTFVNAVDTGRIQEVSGQPSQRDVDCLPGILARELNGDTPITPELQSKINMSVADALIGDMLDDVIQVTRATDLPEVVKSTTGSSILEEEQPNLPPMLKPRQEPGQTREQKEVLPNVQDQAGRKTASPEDFRSSVASVDMSISSAGSDAAVELSQNLLARAASASPYIHPTSPSPIDSKQTASGGTSRTDSRASRAMEDLSGQLGLASIAAAIGNASEEDPSQLLQSGGSASLDPGELPAASGAALGSEVVGNAVTQSAPRADGQSSFTGVISGSSGVVGGGGIAHKPPSTLNGGNGSLHTEVMGSSIVEEGSKLFVTQVASKAIALLHGEDNTSGIVAMSASSDAVAECPKAPAKLAIGAASGRTSEVAWSSATQEQKATQVDHAAVLRTASGSIGGSMTSALTPHGEVAANTCMDITMQATECAVREASSIGGDMVAESLIQQEQAQKVIAADQAAAIPHRLAPGTTLGSGSGDPGDEPPTVQVVTVQATCHGISYQSLVADTALKARFEATIKRAIAQDAGVSEESVILELASGSVVVKATIVVTTTATSREGGGPEAKQSQPAKRLEQADLRYTMLQAVRSLEAHGLKGLTDITVGEVREQVAQSAQAGAAKNAPPVLPASNTQSRLAVESGLQLFARTTLLSALEDGRLSSGTTAMKLLQPQAKQRALEPMAPSSPAPVAWSSATQEQKATQGALEPMPPSSPAPARKSGGRQRPLTAASSVDEVCGSVSSMSAFANEVSSTLAQSAMDQLVAQSADGCTLAIAREMSDLIIQASMDFEVQCGVGALPTAAPPVAVDRAPPAKPPGKSRAINALAKGLRSGEVDKIVVKMEEEDAAKEAAPPAAPTVSAAAPAAPEAKAVAAGAADAVESMQKANRAMQDQIAEMKKTMASGEGAAQQAAGQGSSGSATETRNRELRDLVEGLQAERRALSNDRMEMRRMMQHLCSGLESMATGLESMAGNLRGWVDDGTMPPADLAAPVPQRLEAENQQLETATQEMQAGNNKMREENDNLRSEISSRANSRPNSRPGSGK